MIEVLVVDDSAFMRKVISDILKEDSEINVIDTASNGIEAMEKTILLHPDVITMDVEMPGMDGINTVRSIMQKCPTSILMVSAHTKKGAEKTMKALEAGAVDFVEKPGGTISLNLREVKQDILDKVKIASCAKIPGTEKIKDLLKKPLIKVKGRNLIIIAASTGGPKSIKIVLSRLPENFPSSIIIIQHMPEGFTEAFAKRLNEHCRIDVKEAKDGDTLKSGLAFVAPGGFHLELGNDSNIILNKKPALHGVRPSADITMNSASKKFNGNIIGIILSGMGKDGSIGVKNIKRRGGIIIVQDKDSSIVHGMPKAAIKSGSVDYVISVDRIADKLLYVLKNV